MLLVSFYYQVNVYPQNHSPLLQATTQVFIAHSGSLHGLSSVVIDNTSYFHASQLSANMGTDNFVTSDATALLENYSSHLKCHITSCCAEGIWLRLIESLSKLKWINAPFPLDNCHPYGYTCTYMLFYPPLLYTLIPYCLGQAPMSCEHPWALARDNTVLECMGVHSSRTKI